MLRTNLLIAAAAALALTSRARLAEQTLEAVAKGPAWAEIAE